MSSRTAEPGNRIIASEGLRKDIADPAVKKGGRRRISSHCANDRLGSDNFTPQAEFQTIGSTNPPLEVSDAAFDIDDCGVMALVQIFRTLDRWAKEADASANVVTPH